MTLNVYFVSDIHQGLVATVTLAIRVYVANGGANLEHITGILDHAGAQAALYGIPWAFVINDVRVTLGTGYADLLDRAAVNVQSELERGTHL